MILNNFKQVFALFLTLLFVGISCGPKEGTPEYYLKKLKSTDPVQAERALDRLIDMKYEKAIPDMMLLFSAGKFKGKIALFVARMGKKELASELIKGIDFTVTSDATKEGRKKATDNAKIAEALGMMHVEEAVKPLIQLTKSPINYVQLAAIRALGELGKESAVDYLLSYIDNENVNPFIVKNAIISLGNIGSPKACKKLIKALFVERPGVSFYREASFSLFQIGKACKDDLINAFTDKDPEINKLTEEVPGKPKIFKAAIYAKLAVILGDLRLTEASDLLRKKLTYKDPTGAFDLTVLVQINSAEALGKIGDKRAVPLVSKMLKVEDETVREKAATALTLIGDRSALGPLFKYIGLGSVSMKKFAIDAITNIGDQREIPKVKKLIGREKDEKAKAFFEKAIQRLEAAKECKKDIKCWTGKLKDNRWRVREKAAYVLGHLGAKEAIDELLKLIDDKNNKVRYAVYWALETLGCDRGQEKMKSVLDKEKGKMKYIKIDEDLKRLYVNTKRRAKG